MRVKIKRERAFRKGERKGNKEEEEKKMCE